jgi:hypothetical protein
MEDAGFPTREQTKIALLYIKRKRSCPLTYNAPGNAITNNPLVINCILY